MKYEEFNINGCIYVGDTKITLEEFEDLFFTWCEEKDLKFGGSIVPFKDEEKNILDEL